MYHFDTIRELKLAVRKRCLQYHKEYLSKRNTSLPYTDMSMNYIRFGYEEKNIFHFFTEWSKCVESSVVGVLDDVIEANLILGSICEEMGVSMEEARIIFHHTFIIVHGYACLFAYNDLLFDEKTIFNDYQTMIHGICYEIIKK